MLAVENPIMEYSKRDIPSLWIFTSVYLSSSTCYKKQIKIYHITHSCYINERGLDRALYQ